MAAPVNFGGIAASISAKWRSSSAGDAPSASGNWGFGRGFGCLGTGASTWGAELVERVLVGAATASAARGGTGASSAEGGDEAVGRGDADAASAVGAGELVGDETGEPAASTPGAGVEVDGSGGGSTPPCGLRGGDGEAVGRGDSAVVADDEVDGCGGEPSRPVPPPKPASVAGGERSGDETDGRRDESPGPTVPTVGAGDAVDDKSGDGEGVRGGAIGAGLAVVAGGEVDGREGGTASLVRGEAVGRGDVGAAGVGAGGEADGRGGETVALPAGRGTASVARGDDGGAVGRDDVGTAGWKATSGVRAGDDEADGVGLVRGVGAGGEVDGRGDGPA